MCSFPVISSDVYQHEEKLHYIIQYMFVRDLMSIDQLEKSMYLIGQRVKLADQEKSYFIIE